MNSRSCIPSCLYHVERVVGYTWVQVPPGVLFNHEVWKKCSKCQKHYDVRERGYECPYC